MPRVMMGILIFFVLEIAVIIKVGAYLGALATISWLFLDIVLGIMLVKYKFRALMKTMHSGDPKLIMSGNIGFLTAPLAGFLLIFPGFISDVLALIVLLPGMGKLLTALFVTKLLVKHLGPQAVFTSKTWQQGTFSDEEGGVTVEGTYTEVVEDAPGIARQERQSDDVAGQKPPERK